MLDNLSFETAKASHIFDLLNNGYTKVNHVI